MRFFSDFEKNNRLNDLLGSSVSVNLLSGILLIVVALLVPNSITVCLFSIENAKTILLLTVLAALTQTLSLNILSYFRAKENGKLYMFISLATAFTLIISVAIVLVIFNLGIEGVLYAQIFTFGIMWIMILVWIAFNHGLRLESVIFSKLIKFGSPLIFAMAGDLVINTIGIYLLGFFRNLEEVAIYALAFKIAQISIMVVVGPFQMAYEPYVFKNKNNTNLAENISRIISYVVLIYILSSFTILFVFKDLITLIAPLEYNRSYYLIFFILPGLGFTLFSYIGQSLLHIENKTRTTGTIVVFSTSVSLVLLFFSIKQFGIIGFIFSLNFYIILNSMLLYWLGNKVLKIKVDKIRLSISLLVGTILFISIYLLSGVNNFIYYPIVLLVLALILVILFKANFFTQGEKETIRSLIKI
jgi:O-antigen/teichoic acid export membrane protein